MEFCTLGKSGLQTGVRTKGSGGLGERERGRKLRNGKVKDAMNLVPQKEGED